MRIVNSELRGVEMVDVAVAGGLRYMRAEIRRRVVMTSGFMAVVRCATAIGATMLAMHLVACDCTVDIVAIVSAGVTAVVIDVDTATHTHYI